MFPPEGKSGCHNNGRAVVLKYAVALTLFISEAGLVPTHVDLWSFHSSTLTVPYSSIPPPLSPGAVEIQLTYHGFGCYNIYITLM